MSGNISSEWNTNAWLGLEVFRDWFCRITGGRYKNANKNPVAKHAIDELGLELLKLWPEGGPVSDFTITLAMANTNSRIRHDGLSAREVWTQLDQQTEEQLPKVDRQLIRSQNYSHQQNHTSSTKSKAHGRTNYPQLPSLCKTWSSWKVTETNWKPVRNTSWSAFLRAFVMSSRSSPTPSFATNFTKCLWLNVIQWLTLWLSPLRARFMALRSPLHLTLMMTPTLLSYHQDTPLSLHLL